METKVNQKTTFQLLEEPDIQNQEQETSLLQTLLRHVYDRVYFTAELRAQEDYAKSRNQTLNDRDQLTFKTTKQRLIQFLGFPSGTSKKPIKILKGLAGWNEEYSTSRNVLQALFIFPLNLLLTASKLALNIVKLATEFLPYILAKGSLKLFNICNDFLKSMTSFEESKRHGIDAVVIIGLAKLAVSLGVLILGTLTAALHIAYFIGGATTSPAENFRAAYRAGNELAGGGRGGKVAGVIFALVSALTTGCVYAVLFPVLLTQAPAVLPAIANGISQFVGIFSAQAGASAAAFFTTTLPTALASFGVMINSAIASPLIGFIVGSAASAAIGASVMTPVVVAIDEVGEMQGKEEDQEDCYIRRASIIKYTNREDIFKEENEQAPYQPYYPPLLTVASVKKALGIETHNHIQYQ